jgi:hypothetical protein
MLIAEKFLLLVIDDGTGKRIIGRDRLEPALGGAVLAELALRERIGITGDEAGLLKRRRVTVLDPTPTGDEVLDQLLARIGEKPDQKAANLISTMNFGRATAKLLEQLTDRLVAARVLSEERGRILGLIPTSSWPTVDPAPERAVRQWLEAALIAGATPDEPTRVLIALLSATDSLAKVVPSDDRRAVRARAKELTKGDWIGREVKQVIDEVTAAVTAAVIASASSSG